jgi:hypothetical protein
MPNTHLFDDVPDYGDLGGTRRTAVMRYPLNIEFLTALGLPTIQVIELAAEIGCPHISLALQCRPRG